MKKVFLSLLVGWCLLHLPLVSASVPEDSFSQIFLKNGTIDISKGVSEFPSEWLQKEITDNYYLVHFDNIIQPEWRKKLESIGTIVSYIPSNTYLVKLEGQKVSAVSSLSHVDWVDSYHPFFKLDGMIFKQPVDRGMIKVRITLFGGEPYENVENAVIGMGGEMINTTDQPNRRRAVALIPEKDLINVLKTVAFLPEVEWVQAYPDYEFCNDFTQWVAQSGPYSGGMTPLYDRGIKGAGQIVGVMDTGADADMCFFYDVNEGLIPPNDPNFNQRKIVAYIGPAEYANGYDSQGHGTHTAGTIAGDNYANPGEHDNADGIALLAKLIVQDYGDGWDVYPPDDEYSAHQAVYDLDGRVHSNSWGWPSNPGVYHDDCMEVDQFVWDHPNYTLVYAAGNEGSGSDTIRPPGTSKNVVTVGATESGGANPENNAYFSSHGPTDDGRRKPDITIPGENINSAANDGSSGSYNCSSTSMSGTSMATPGAAGCAVLIRDYFAQGFYPLGIADEGFALDPSAALVKAIMINSGVNMTGSNTADSGEGHADIPSHGQGWGRITLDSALYFQNDTRMLFIDDNTAGISGAGDSIEYLVAVSSSDEPLEITLVWSDYPSNPEASVNLVNDLDLTVTINGVMYRGNVYSQGHSIPGGTADRLNNVECVQIDNPPIGAYSITITGYNVPQGPQPFAMAVTGALNFSDGVVAFDNTQYACSGSAMITVSDADIAGTLTHSVIVSSTLDPMGEVITLNEVGVESGIFQGSVQFTTGSPGAGQVQIANGDTVTVTYTDADDGHGGINIQKTDTATIDCVPPVISNVIISWISSHTAQIYWETNELATSTITYGDTMPLQFTESDSSLTMYHTVQLESLTECMEYFFSVTSADRAGNSVTDTHGGDYYSFTTYAVYVMLNENMDSNPGWAFEGQWAWGQPTGADGDPTAGYTGQNVVGYNLNGAYPDNMPVYYATTPSFNCSGASETILTFWKWLGIESSAFDHATVEVSNDGGVSWTAVWSHEGSSIQPSQWEYMEIDITDLAAGQSNVKLRWSMGPSDGSVVYCGWNIDDVLVSYTAPCNVPNLIYGGHEIDDSVGNNDGEINSGETITMPVTLQNLGLDATGVSATLVSSNPHVTITQNHVNFPNIPQSTSGSSIGGFVFQVAPTAGNGEAISFTVGWTSNEASGSTGFTVHVVAPQLVIESSSVIDAQGDMDGFFDPNETVQIVVTLFNDGDGTAHDVVGTLTSDHPQYITISDGTASFPELPAGSSGPSLAPHFTVTSSSSTPDHTLVTFTLTMTGQGFSTTDEFAIDVTRSTFGRRYFWSLDTNPGWVTENQWAWGIPQGSGGDPASGFTGQNVYGYNLAGTYPNNLPETNLTTSAIDCSLLTDVEVRFQRWLGIESSVWDHAYFRVSNDGINWTTVWSHTGSTFQDSSWQAQTFDISAVADNQRTVYLRWVMGSTDSSVVYSGWNIDDIEIWSESSAPAPTFTPAPPTSTPTPVPPTRTPTNTPVQTCIHHGDVNFNGSITAGDAQLSFQYALGIGTPSYAESCAADCNGNGSITAGDAQSIFAAALGLGSCVDPMATQKSAEMESPVQDKIQERLQSVIASLDDHIWLEFERSSNTIVVEVMTSNETSTIDAFTTQVRFDPSVLQFSDCEVGSLEPGWVDFGCNESAPGIITVGAYTLGLDDSDMQIARGSYGSLARLMFTTQNDISDLKSLVTLSKLADDIEAFGINVPK